VDYSDYNFFRDIQIKKNNSFTE